jgi:MFS family permease
VTTRELLRHRGLLAVLVRDVVSVTGSQMTWVAIPWFVLTTTGSPARMTLVLAVEAAALGVVGFLSGNIVSRLGPRRTMLIADGARGPLVALIPILHYADALSFPLLLAIVAAIGAFATPSIASKQTLLPELVGEDERTLTEANALLQGANRLTMILGPPIGGALIGLFGATSVLLIDAATFVIAFILIATFVRVGGAVADDDESRGLTAGARFIAGDSLLRPWTATVIVSDAIWLALFGVMPVLVLERFGEDPTILGAIWGAWGAGAVVGSVGTFRLIARMDGLLVGSIGEIGMTAPLWLLLLDLPAFVVIGTMFVSGLANGIVNAPIHTIISLRTPRALRAKVWSVVIVGSALLGPPVLVVTGPALEQAGLVSTLLVLLVVQSVAVVGFTVAGLRERSRINAAVVESASSL